MKQDHSLKNSSNKRTPPASFVKLAMKNMVKKGSQSIFHFGLTAIGFIAFILVIAAIGRPSIPH
ncbi:MULTISPECIES: DUF3285 domain-containing protein [unclassified Prochlorococcus]|uniref:DUF3285 domain-containing protein n=1 Tax=unclassified Prochlorococcus TaxID=2627481 RepID=UPI000533BBB2|nr:MULTISPECIES: DUF3285 domain-containing protein [unclassified Prochlorococcus]KGG16756.1 hypothetical protein EV06_0598 [Prochlorococcus sp. MIT 0602]KGG18270.1 hypothetical protein EV07_0186 [Prochlorococcus sp. MIT 0603]